MKRFFITIGISSLLLLTSCGDWLEILPKNKQVTANFWKSKEEVEAVLASGYRILRNATPDLIDWGELRAGSIYPFSNAQKQRLYNFQLTSNDALCRWTTLYQVLNMANSVIHYGPSVQHEDETYLDAYLNSHLTEAYFLRSLVNFYLVRNFLEVPLVTEPYIDDSAPFAIAKSSEEQLIAQIKTDIQTALSTGAAKEFFEDEQWEGASKGRATKWALYALMADVCLWSEDYDACIEYCDLLIHATASRRPVFISDPDQWFDIFNPGNSNESIFEINWQSTSLGQTTNSPSTIFSISLAAQYQYGAAMCERLYAESQEETLPGYPASVRAEYGAYYDAGQGAEPKQYVVWKYYGDGVDNNMSRPYTDANWIIYRMAEILLIKAEALIWKGQANYAEAMELINQVRNRARLQNLSFNPATAEELTMLEAVLHERDIELAAEGKRWYDLVRFGRS